MGNHEGLGVEVSVGDGVHGVDLGVVLHPHVVVAGVGGQSADNNNSLRLYCHRDIDLQSDLFAMSGFDFSICCDLVCLGLALERGVGTILPLSIEDAGEERPESELEDFT